MSSATVEQSLRIGEVASRLGVTTRTIRYYEQLGLVGSASERQKGSHRLYSVEDVARLRELFRLRDLLGLSLEELATLAEAEEARRALRDQWDGTESDDERLRIVEEATLHVNRQLALVESRRARLDEVAGELTEKLSTLEAHRRRLRRKGAR